MARALRATSGSAPRAGAESRASSRAGSCWNAAASASRMSLARPCRPRQPRTVPRSRATPVMRGVGDAFLPAYAPIVDKRRGMVYGERERDWQAYRRGRYVEFNLVWDRGTLFGLQSGGRAESILMSLPPIVKWRYDWKPEPGSPEAKLAGVLTPPRDWANMG